MDELELRVEANLRGWYIRECASTPTSDGDYHHRFEVTLPDRDLIKIMNKSVDPFKPHWPQGLQLGDCFQVLCDDKGRTGASWLRVLIANDGDVHLMMQDWEEFPDYEPSPFPSIRCRNDLGGGRNHRTHQALLWLAQAIRLDNEENQR